MNQFGNLRRRLSAVLAAALLFLCVSPGFAIAAEETETVEATQGEAPSTTAAEITPAETTEETLTEETTREPDSGSSETTPVEMLFSGEIGLVDILWYPTVLEDVLPTDILAVTMTMGGGIWAVSSENAEYYPPKIVNMTAENGMAVSASPDLGWQIERTENGICLRPEGSQLRLYTENGNDALRVGPLGNPEWTVEGNALRHRYTDRYLYANVEKGHWQTVLEVPEDQILTFWRKERTAPVSAVPASGVLENGERVALSCADPQAEIWYALSVDGTSYSGFQLYTQPLAMDAEASALYIKTYTRSTEKPASPEMVFSYTREALPEEKPEWDLPLHCYFGQLHAHTAISDSLAGVEDTFQYAAGVEGLDFFAVTDHSDSFQNANLGSIGKDGSAISDDWNRGKAAARAVTSDTFVGIYGYEMSWPEGKNLGHIGTFATPGWQSWKQSGFSSLERYYEAMASVPTAIGQFQHPGVFYGNFEEFSHYSAVYDQRMNLLEVGGEGNFRAYGAYTQALDMGWHVAPTNNLSTRQPGWTGSARTVLLAPELTEEALYDAMRQRRAYATDDSDLEIYFTLDDAPMGSILPVQKGYNIIAYLAEPTDQAVGVVEVIADGGRVVASRTVDTPWAELSIPVQGGYAYYYLRITQADGDIAVTAPVWVDQFQDMGISSFTSDPTLAVQGQEIRLSVTLYNEETVPFQISAMELYAGDTLIHRELEPKTVAPADTLEWSLPYTHPGLGVTRFRVRVIGTVLDAVRSYEDELAVRYHAAQQVGDILVDGSHGNRGLESLNRLAAIAGEADLQVTVFTEGVPTGGSLLLIPPPGEALEESFIESVQQFLEAGGSLMVFGQAGENGTLNRLLWETGATLRFSGGVPAGQTPACYNTNAAWSAGVYPQSIYYHDNGCAIDPGGGTWLVKDPESGAVLFACEETGYGGSVFACGSLLLSDRAMPEPQDRWDPVSANQKLIETILGVHREELPLSAIREAREGSDGSVFRVQGYATTGTANPYNTFPGTLCLQDDTGGIPIVDFTDPGIAVGTPLEVTGYRQLRDGNIVLALIDYHIMETDHYRYVPETEECQSAMDYGQYGGQLRQVEGTVVAITYTEDGKGVSRLMLRDSKGGLAEVVIGENIFSGSRGSNTLASEIKLRRTVRAMGILYLEDGVPVLRVRNCEEVVYVPPVRARGNPWTGDSLSPDTILIPMALSGVPLLILLAKRRRWK